MRLARLPTLCQIQINPLSRIERTNNMGITKHGLELAGFKSLGKDETVRGIFTRIEVFEIQGFTLNAPCHLPIEERIFNIPFKLGFGDSLNEICNSLVGDDFVDDEEQWKKDKLSAPPFMLVAFGPTGEHSSSGTHVKRHETSIATYDSFREAKDELKSQVDAVIPPLLTALAITFSNEQQLVRFIPRQSAFVGTTRDGTTIYDLRFEFSGGSYSSQRISAEQLNEQTGIALDRANQFTNKVADFHYLAANETDPLKRFLFFFLSLERMINSTFECISNPCDLAAVVLLTSNRPKLTESLGWLLRELQRGNGKVFAGLRARFLWCVTHRWNHMTDADFEIFRTLIEVRNDIAHGHESKPNGAAVTEIETLALRIMGDV